MMKSRVGGGGGGKASFIDLVDKDGDAEWGDHFVTRR